MKLFSLLAAAFVSAVLSGCGDSGTSTPPSTAPGGGAATSGASGSTGGSSGKTVIAVIPKGTTHEFWKSVEAGARKAGSEHRSIEVRWQGPQKEDDRDAQIKVLENMVAAKVGAIVIAPLDDTALVDPINEAVRSKVPVIVIDSAVKTDKYVSFIATDNKEGGRIAGREMGKLLGNKGKVAVLRYQAGSASTQEREDGFIEGAKEGGLEIARASDEAGPTKETALKAAENMINALRAPSGDKLTVDGIFAPNESSARGMLKALQDAKFAGKVKFIGFDSAEELIQGLNAGEINGLVLQDPFQMGYLGVKEAVEAIKSEKNRKKAEKQPLPPVYVSKANLDDPKVKQLIGK